MRAFTASNFPKVYVDSLFQNCNNFVDNMQNFEERKVLLMPDKFVVEGPVLILVDERLRGTPRLEGSPHSPQVTPVQGILHAHSLLSSPHYTC